MKSTTTARDRRTGHRREQRTSSKKTKTYHRWLVSASKLDEIDIFVLSGPCGVDCWSRRRRRLRNDRGRLLRIGVVEVNGLNIAVRELLFGGVVKFRHRWGRGEAQTRCNRHLRVVLETLVMFICLFLHEGVGPLALALRPARHRQGTIEGLDLSRGRTSGDGRGTKMKGRKRGTRTHLNQCSVPLPKPILTFFWFQKKM